MLIIPHLPNTHQQFIYTAFSHHTPINQLYQHNIFQGEAWHDIYTQGCVYLIYNEYNLAHQAFTRACTNVSNNKELQLHCQRALAKVALEHIEPTNTAIWDTLITQYSLLDQEYEVGRTTIQKALAQYNGYRIKETEASLDSIKNISDYDPYSQVCYYRLRFSLDFNKSLFKEAQEYLEIFLNITQRYTMKKEQVEGYILTLRKLLVEPNYTDAAILMSSVEKSVKDIDIPELNASFMRVLGVIYKRQSNYPAAVYNIDKSRHIYTKLNRELDSATCATNMGMIYEEIGFIGAALEEFVLVTNIYTKLEATGRLAAIFYRLARLEYSQDNLNQSQDYLNQARVMAQNTNHTEMLFAIELLQAQLFTRNGSIDKALLIYKDLLNQPQNSERSQIYLDLATIAFARKEYDKALLSFNQVDLTTTKDMLLKWRYFYGLAKYAELQGEWQTAIRHYQAALTIVVSIRQSFRSESMSSFMYHQTMALFQDSMRCVYNHGTPNQILHVTEQQRTITFVQLIQYRFLLEPNNQQQRLRKKVQELLAQPVEKRDETYEANLKMLLESYTRYTWEHQTRSIEPYLDINDIKGFQVDVDQIRQVCTSQYGVNWTAVIYSPFDTKGAGQFLRMIITPDGEYPCLLTWSKELDTFLQEVGSYRQRRNIFSDIHYRKLQEQFHDLARSTQPWKQHVQLTDVLIPEDLKNRIKDDLDHRLFIVPTGVLHSVPWATLRIDNSWLCEKAIVHIIPHLALLLAPPKTKTGPAYFYGCKDFEGRHKFLEQALKDWDIIEEIWPNNSTKRVEGTYEEVLADTQYWNKYALLHFSTHASMQDEQGVAACIALKNDDLWIDRIKCFSIDSACIVLSVCHGAKVDQLPGDEYLSLSWNWLTAGAGSVIASLWFVNDGESAEFLKMFYSYIHAGYDTAKALTYAQRDSSKLYPYQGDMWGCFVHTGAINHIFIQKEDGACPL